MPFDPQNLKAILAVLEGSDVTRLEWSNGEEHLRINLGHPPVAAQAQVHHHGGSVTQAAPAPVAAPAPFVPPAVAAAPKVDPKTFTVNSPFVGTFYRSASPDAPPFVEPGTVVRKGQALCIVEAMKLMNEIEAEKPGKIVECLVQNGSPVEYGEALFRLEPA
jgi:acetyl-CoA carboxylase biotin carboxyl carrier protein